MFRIFLLITTLFIFSENIYAKFDPTRPPYYKDTTGKSIRKSELSISAIIVSKDRRVAVVNDQIVKTGDEISGVKVIEINKDSVRFQGLEGYFSVPLNENIKQ